MILIANFISGLADVMSIVLDIAMLLIIARAIISWFNVSPYNNIARFLSNVTDPILYKLRRRCPWLIQGGMDFAPMLILVTIIFLKSFLVLSLKEYSVEMKRANVYQHIELVSEQLPEAQR